MIRTKEKGSDVNLTVHLLNDGWPEKFSKAAVRRGRPPLAKPKVSTTIRLSQDVIDSFPSRWPPLADTDRRGPSRVDREARHSAAS